MHAHTHIHIHTCMHTNTHTHKHTHMGGGGGQRDRIIQCNIFTETHAVKKSTYKPQQVTVMPFHYQQRLNYSVSTEDTTAPPPPPPHTHKHTHMGGGVWGDRETE